jgi:hypothetical protein
MPPAPPPQSCYGRTVTLPEPCAIDGRDHLSIHQQVILAHRLPSPRICTARQTAFCIKAKKPTRFRTCMPPAPQSGCYAAIRRARLVLNDNRRGWILRRKPCEERVYYVTRGRHGGIVARRHQSTRVANLLIRIGQCEEIARHPPSICATAGKEEPRQDATRRGSGTAGV